MKKRKIKKYQKRNVEEESNLNSNPLIALENYFQKYIVLNNYFSNFVEFIIFYNLFIYPGFPGFRDALPNQCRKRHTEDYDDF